MGGSFESGAGDDPNDLFRDSIDDEESDDDEPAEAGVEAKAANPESRGTETEVARQMGTEAGREEGQSRVGTPEGNETTSHGAGEQTEATGPSSSSGSVEANGPSQSEESGLPEAHDAGRAGTTDAAQLARAFVPDSYEKPHPWALGRNGVNDGRTEKKTFFLQSDVIALEAACLGEVNQMLDGEVPLTDLRELALILAYHDPERLAEAALEWGSESA